MADAAKQSTVFDSDQQLVGDIYARALLEHGQDSKSSDKLVEELGAVVGVLNDLPKMKLALESPRIPHEAKSEMLDKAFKGKVSGDLLNFLKVIGQRGRFDCLQAVSSSAEKLLDEYSGRVQATLTTAEAVEDSVRNDISSKLAKALGKEVNLATSVDPSIIGGMVIRVGDTVYDGSVVNQLNQVRVNAVKRASDAIREKLDRFTGA